MTKLQMKKKIVELFNSIDFENLNEKQKGYYKLFVKYSIRSTSSSGMFFR